MARANQESSKNAYMASSTARPATAEPMARGPRELSWALENATPLPRSLSPPKSPLGKSQGAEMPSPDKKTVSWTASGNAAPPTRRAYGPDPIEVVTDSGPDAAQAKLQSPIRRRASLSQPSKFEQWYDNQKSAHAEKTNEKKSEQDRFHRQAKPKEHHKFLHSDGKGNMDEQQSELRDLNSETRSAQLGSVVHSKQKKRAMKDMTEVKKIFKRFDTDESGKIEPSEFLPLLAILLKRPQASIDKGEVWKYWEVMDHNGDGFITIDEFLKWYCIAYDIGTQTHDYSAHFDVENLVSKNDQRIRKIAKQADIDIVQADKLWQEFSKLDTDGSGELEFCEFQSLMEKQLCAAQRHHGKQRQEVPDKVMQKFWNDIDADGSGAVTFEEFVMWYKKFFVSNTSPMEHYYEVVGKGWRSKPEHASDTCPKTALTRLRMVGMVASR